MKSTWIFKVLLMALIPLSSYAGDSDGSIESRLYELEKRVSALEQGSTKSSKQPKVKTSESNATGWKNKANWRALKKGMSEAEVTQLLGEPDKIQTGGVINFWNYKNGGSVTFHSDSTTVYGWDER